MKTFGYCLVIVLLTITARAEIPLNPVPEGSRFKSPDGKFIVSGELEIADTSTGEKVVLPWLGPVYYVEWAGNSKFFVVVSHIAHGSYATLVKPVPGGWKKFNIDPDLGNLKFNHYEKYEVADVKISNSKVRFEFIVSAKEHSAEKWREFKSSLQVDPSTLEISGSVTEEGK
jgi:hypothetical protein